MSLGIHIDGQQFRASYFTMRDLLCDAYNVIPQQIEGPDWITSERFEVNATMPTLPGGKVTEEQYGVMLRALLEERFQLKSHRASKDLPVYLLQQAKDGIKPRA